MSDVSVILAVRDGRRYLADAIGSVLAQTAPPAEIVVVDDGSVDGSGELAASLGEPVRVVRQEPDGLAAALNHGVAEARHPLVAMIDSDDLWTPEKLATQGAALAADPALDAVFGHVEQFTSPELSEEEVAALNFRAGSLPFRSKGTMLARRALLDSVGPFDETLGVGEFIDGHARAEEGGMRSAMLGEVVLLRRLHASNWGRSEAADQVDYARVARAALHRRRAAGG